MHLVPARNQNLCHQCQAWVKRHLAHPCQSPTADHSSALPPPTPPFPDSSCLFIRCQALYASSCTVLLYFSRYFKIKKFFFLCYLCEKYYKPITAQLLLFRCSVMPDSSRPHGLQHTRLPCPSSHPGACSNSRPMSRWCHPTISTSVDPFSSGLQSFPASGCFLISQLFK